MKIIEAMKQVKANDAKVTDLQAKISQNCATLSIETPVYGDRQADQIKEWLQSAYDTNQESIRLLTAISRTNLATQVTISLGDTNPTKSIAEWIHRRGRPGRQGYAAVDLATYKQLSDRGLREGTLPVSQVGMTPIEVKIIRHFDPVERDTRMAIFSSEATLIDAALEVANATTDLIEVI